MILLLLPVFFAFFCMFLVELCSIALFMHLFVFFAGSDCRFQLFFLNRIALSCVEFFSKMTTPFKLKNSAGENPQLVRNASKEQSAMIQKHMAENKKKKEETRRALNDARVPVERLSPLALTEAQRKQLEAMQKTPAKEDETQRLETLWRGGGDGENSDSGDDHYDSDGDPEFIPPEERGESGEEDDGDESGGQRRRFIPLTFDASKADGNAETAARRLHRRGVRHSRNAKLREAAGVTFKERRERAEDNLRKLRDAKKMKTKERKRPLRLYRSDVLDKAVEEYQEEREKRVVGPGGQAPKGTGVRAIAKRVNIPKSTLHDHSKKKRRKILGKFQNFRLFFHFLISDSSGCDFSYFHWISLDYSKST